jgi:prepilin-type N-terminal cleavage/methylation domain-containing protein
VRKRLRVDQEGFGLIELLIAMVILNIGLLAIVASSRPASSPSRARAR